MTYRLISEKDLVAFAAVLARNGWRDSAFELEENAFDQATAEVEAAQGEVGVKCLATQAVAVYRIGSGLDWVSDFARDLHAGKMGSPRAVSR